MRTAWTKIIVIILTLLFSFSAVAQSSDFDKLRHEYRDQQQHIQLMVNELETLEENYQQDLAEIETLKSQKSSFVRDMKLQTLLSGARAHADLLKTLAHELREIQGQNQELKAKLLEHYGQTLDELEAELLSAPAEMQALLITQLEQLQQEREDLREGLHRLPAH